MPVVTTDASARYAVAFFKCMFVSAYCSLHGAPDVFGHRGPKGQLSPTWRYLTTDQGGRFSRKHLRKAHRLSVCAVQRVASGASARRSTSALTPRRHDKSVLPRISTERWNTALPDSTSSTRRLMLMIKLLTFCTQHTPTRSTPSLRPTCRSQPLHAFMSCAAVSCAIRALAGALSATRKSWRSRNWARRSSLIRRTRACCVRLVSASLYEALSS